METHVLTFTITTTFEEWVTTYDGSTTMMADAGITSLFRGAGKDEPTTICAVLQAPPGALEAFIAKNAELVAASGHVLESTVDQVFLAGN